MDIEFEYIRPNGESLSIVGSFEYYACCDCSERFHNHIDDLRIDSVVDEEGREVEMNAFEEAKIQLRAVNAAYEALEVA